MENVIEQLSGLQSEGFVVYCIKQWIAKGVSAESIIHEIRSIAADNPPMMERALGTELFTQIMQP